MSVLTITEARRHRHRRIRKKISGTADRPRMALSVSRKRMTVQLIDDERGVTLAAATSMPDREPKNVAGARKLGERIGSVIVEKGICDVVVDRGGFKYHGRIRAVVEGAMSSGVRVGSAKPLEGADTKARSSS